MIKSLLDRSTKVSLTTDGWDSVSVDPYLSLTCHFVDEDWVLREVLIDFGDNPFPHTGSYLCELIDEVNNQIF